jgi:hypothetical protein
MDLDEVLRASENLNADLNFGQQVPALERDIVQVREPATKRPLFQSV